MKRKEGYNLGAIPTPRATDPKRKKSRATKIVELFTETADVVKSLANKSGKSVAEVEGMWDEIKQSLSDDGKQETDPQFYGLLVSILKKKLNID